MPLICIKDSFKMPQKTFLTTQPLARISECTGITPDGRNLLALFLFTVSITPIHTPALCITFDTKTRKMEGINKVQAVPLLFPTCRRGKTLHFLLTCFLLKSLVFIILFTKDKTTHHYNSASYY